MADEPRGSGLTYAKAGVDLAARHKLLGRLQDAASRATRPEVVAGVGPFAGLFRLGDRYRDPVLVSSTDGVGTKVKLAAAVGRYESLGHDVVNQSVNDALTVGAEPLFFLDYLGNTGLPDDAKVEIVRGIADACRAVGAALLGGETADMPGTYAPGDFDLVGFVVGIVERDRLIDGSGIRAGDALLALPSSGLHTNGYSLVRQALGIATEDGDAAGDRERLERYEEDLGETLADALLRPHRCYVNELKPALERPGLVKGVAHITGGGIEKNVPRVLPDSLGARFDLGTWTIPPVFALIEREGGIEREEMFRVFNMGLGMVLAVAAADVEHARALVPEARVVGEVVAGSGVKVE